jgi:tRNA threonylcarbamoyladenosine biosynthesis protein TsaB
MALRLSAKTLAQEGASVGPVLGIDTSSALANLGIVAQGRIAAVLSRCLVSHCGGLPSAVDDVLEEANLRLSDLAAVAVALGPGSFTGLRVGLSYAKGLVTPSKLAIIGVSTLDTIALCATSSRLHEGAVVCPIIDARKGEVYTALYRVVTDALQKTTGDLVISVKDFASHVSGEVFFAGDAQAQKISSLFRASHGRAVALGSAELRQRGGYVAAIGAARLARNEIDAASTLEPVYVRPPDTSANFTALKSGEINGTPRGRAHSAIRRA